MIIKRSIISLTFAFIQTINQSLQTINQKAVFAKVLAKND